ncbi:ArnT family glycosyltransferase [Haloarcula marina]|uniref:ArnT family glycosyltransferase n=1 Tax=Haloarcula marina TaxID=2961574 RepID=UPI0020B7FEEA|nr:glycosyltransferase family 39 protein [Halomicroarcula marina]
MGVEDAWPVDDWRATLTEHGPLLAVISLTLLGGFVRLVGLGLPPLLDGEAIIGLTARGLERTGFDALPSGTNYGRGILLTYLAWAATGVVGDNLFALRLPVAILTTFSVPLLYGIGLRVFDRRVAVLAATLQSLSFLTIAWSRTARFYALLQLFVLAVMYCAIRLDEVVDLYAEEVVPSDERLRVALFAVGLLVAVLAARATHRQWLVLPIILGLYLLIPTAVEPNRVVYAKLAVWVVIGFNLTTLLFAQQLAVPPFVFDAIPQLGAVDAVSLWEHPRSGNTPPHFFFSYYPVLSVVAVAGSLVAAWRRGSRYALILLWLYVPLTAFTYLGENFRFIWRPRYLLLFLPAFFLLTALGATSLATRVLDLWDEQRDWRDVAAVAILCLLVISPVAQDVGVSTEPHALSQLEEPQPDYREAYNTVEAAREPDDIVITNRPKKWYYWAGSLDYRGNRHAVTDNGTDYYTGVPAIETPQEMRRVVENHDRVWVVYNPFMRLRGDQWVREEMTLYAVIESPFDTRYPHGLYADADAYMDDERVFIYTKGIEPAENQTRTVSK